MKEKLNDIKLFSEKIIESNDLKQIKELAELIRILIIANERETKKSNYRIR